MGIRNDAKGHVKKVVEDIRSRELEEATAIFSFFVYNLVRGSFKWGVIFGLAFGFISSLLILK